MKHKLTLIFFAIATMTVSMMLAYYFPAIKAKPDLFLIFVVFIAITSDKTSDIFIAFSLGYIFDILSGCPVGLYAMLRTITFVALRLFNMNLFSKNALFFTITTFMISVPDSIYLGYRFNYASGFFSILGHALYLSFINAGTALLLYPLLEKLEHKFLISREEIKGNY